MIIILDQDRNIYTAILAKKETYSNKIADYSENVERSSRP